MPTQKISMRAVFNSVSLNPLQAIGTLCLEAAQRGFTISDARIALLVSNLTIHLDREYPVEQSEQVNSRASYMNSLFHEIGIGNMRVFTVTE